MKRTLVALALALGIAAVVAAAALARQGAAPTLVGTVGPGYSISLTMNGKAVKTLKHGTFKLVVHDKASVHGWSLDGPHAYAKDFTAVPFVGTKTFTVTWKAGKYKYYCPAHEPTMFGHFSVT